MQLQEREFTGNLYRPTDDMVKAYSDGYLLICATTALRLDADQNPTRFLNPSEDMLVADWVDDVSPIDTDVTVTLKKGGIDGDFYTLEYDFDVDSIGPRTDRKYLVDETVVVSIESTMNRVTGEAGDCIDALSAEEYVDHEDLYVLTRDGHVKGDHHSFGRFHFLRSKVHRLFNTDRVARLMPVNVVQ